MFDFIKKRKRFFYLFVVLFFVFITAGYILADWQGGTAVYNIKSAPRDGLIGYWTMDSGDVNVKTVYDKSGNGYNGTASNTPVMATGKRKQAIDFETAIDDYIDLGATIGSKINTTNNFTASVWVKMESFTNNAGIVGIGSSGARQIWIYTATAGNQIIFQTEIVDIKKSVVVSGYNTGQWYNLVLKYDGSTLTAFIDGVSVGTPVSTSGLIETATTANFIGRIWGFDYFDGLIDEVRIYNKALTNDQIVDLYNANKINYIQSAPRNGLVGYWNMDSNDINGTTVYDKSGYENNGTLVNSPTTGVVGKKKEAVDFETSSNQSITLPSGVATHIPLTNALTATAWIKIESFQNSAGIIGLGDSSNRQIWIYTLAGGQMTFITSASGAAASSTLSGLSTDVWYFMVWKGSTVSGSMTATIYDTNGNIVTTDTDATFTGNIISGTSSNALGLLTGYDDFDGIIDEVRIYNRVLSATEVNSLHNATKINFIQ